MLHLNHKKTRLWSDCMALLQEVYTLTSSFPIEERYGIVSQLRRAGVSVLSNFGEGSSRRTLAERRRFYEISRASVVEIDTQAEASIRLGYIADDRKDELSRLLNAVFSQLSALMKSMA